MKNSLGRKKAWYTDMTATEVIGTLASKAVAVETELAKGNKENSRIAFVAFDNMYNEVLPAIASVKEYASTMNYNEWQQSQKDIASVKSKLVESVKWFNCVRV